jgi:predicted transcriptional regulator
MSLVTIRLNDALAHTLVENAQAMHMSKAEYIRTAIEHMNAEIERQERKQKLIQASLLVKNESMKVNSEFSEIEDDSKF